MHLKLSRSGEVLSREKSARGKKTAVKENETVRDRVMKTSENSSRHRQVGYRTMFCVGDSTSFLIASTRTRDVEKNMFSLQL